MADVFISYAREDNARAEQVARALEAQGLEVFWDSEIPPGQTWADYIESKLTSCRAVVVLWSEHSTRSQWVREEARMGRDKGKLIPAMLDGSPAPFGFGEVQAANLSTWNGEPDHPEWARTLGAVQAAVAGAPPSPAPPPQPAVSPPRTVQPAYTPPSAPAAAKKPWFTNPLVIAGGVVAALIVVGAVAVGVSGGGKPAAEAEAVSASPAPAPQPPQPGQRNVQIELQSKLAAATGYMQQEGFQAVGEPFVSSLAANATQDAPLELHAGFDYRLVAICDNDCSDIDLWLYDQNNIEVGSDVAVDAQPIVQVAPRWTGPFSLRIGMITCSVEPCYFAVQLYGRAAQ